MKRILIISALVFCIFITACGTQQTLMPFIAKLSSGEYDFDGYKFYFYHENNPVINPDMYIFTYDNKWIKNTEVWDDYYEEVVGGYTSGVSVAYLDKEWNLEKLVVTEKWNVLDENGAEIERERIITLTYYDTSDEDIKRALEDEYDMIMLEVYGTEYEENN